MKVIKMVLPVTAILFAVVAAFATTAPSKNLAKVEISIRSGACEKDGVCTEGGNVICTYQNNGTTFLDTYTSGLPATCAAYSALGVWSTN